MDYDFHDVPLDPQLVTLLSGSNLLKEGPSTDNLKPVQAQYDLKPGDGCLLAGADSPVDSFFGCAKLVDPADHQIQFPDWEERLQKSYVLTEFWSGDQTTPTLAWFSRVRLVPVTEEQFETVKEWVINDNPPDSPPDWMTEVYQGFMGDLHSTEPNKIARSATCPSCGKEGLKALVAHTNLFRTDVGVVKHPETGEEHFCTLEEKSLETKCQSHIELNCPHCGWEKDTSRESFLIPADGKLSQMIQHGHDHGH